MGLFDTVHLSNPLRLPESDRPVTHFQTKEFGSAMRDFTIGSVLNESPVLIGVVKDSVWCEPREKGGKGTSHPVYIAVWHRILAGVYLDPAEAEARLRSVDRLDLIAWLDEAQRAARRWRRRYRSLFADVDEWRERQAEDGTEAEEEKRFRFRFHRLSDDILKAPDPLAALLESHRQSESEDDGDSWLW